MGKNKGYHCLLSKFSLEGKEGKIMKKPQTEKNRNFKRCHVIIFTWICVVLNLQAQQRASENLIINPGFENDFQGWSVAQVDFATHKFDVSIDTTVFRSGSKSAKIEYVSGPDNSYTWFTQRVYGIKPGHSYKLSIWVKREGVVREQKVDIRWADKVEPYRHVFPPPKSSDWERHDIYVLAPKEGVSLSLSLVMSGKGTMWFDDLELIEAPISKDSNLLVKEGHIFNYKPRESEEGSIDKIKIKYKSKDYLIYSRGDPRDIYSYSIPKENELIKKINISATPGEYEPAWFSVFALTDLKDVKIEIKNDLISKGKDIIKKENIDIRTVKCWPQRTDWKSLSYYIIPELLEKKDKVDIPEYTTQTFYLIIKIPETTKPGYYSTMISISVPSRKEETIRFNLRVLPFKLKLPKNKIWAIYVGEPLGQIDKAKLEKILLDIKEHGIMGTHWPLPDYTGDIEFEWANDRIVGFKSAGLSIIQEIRKKIEMKGPLILTTLGGIIESRIAKHFNINRPWNKLVPEMEQERFKEAFRDALKAIDKFIKESGGVEYSDWIFEGIDEPGIHPDRQPFSLWQLSLAKEAGVKTYVTISGEFYYKIAPFITFPCFSGDICISDMNNRKRIVETAIKNRNILWYYGSGCYTNQEGGLMPNRYITGFLFWKSKAGGQVSWTYRRYGTGDFCNDFDGEWFPEPKDAVIAYPGEDDPNEIVPTLQWEGIREGIDDYKYAYTLEELIKEAKKSEKKSVKEIGKKTEEKLKVLLDSIPWWDECKKAKFDNIKASEIRKSIVNLTIGLIEVLK